MSLLNNNNYQYLNNNNYNSNNNNNNNNNNNLISLCENANNVMELIMRDPIIENSNSSEINKQLIKTIKTLIDTLTTNIKNDNNTTCDNNNNNNYKLYVPPMAPMLKGLSCQVPFESLDFMQSLDDSMAISVANTIANINNNNNNNNNPTISISPVNNNNNNNNNFFNNNNPSSNSTPTHSLPSSPTTSSTPFPPTFNLSNDSFNQQIQNNNNNNNNYLINNNTTQYLPFSTLTINNNNNNNNLIQTQLPQQVPIQMPYQSNPINICMPPPFYLDESSQSTMIESIDWNRAKISDFNFYSGSNLGSGSFGTAKLCRHRDTGLFFCSKTLRRDSIVHDKHKEHVSNETSIMLSTNHPYIVKTYATFQTPTKIHFIMEYASKKDLFHHLGQNKSFNESTSKLIVAEIILAIEYLHNENIIYRDLKPENILIDNEGHIKLTDFGFSKKTHSPTSSVCGTFDYMAPEILISTNGYGKEVDWWALGIVVYELISGKLPFNNSKESLLNRKADFQFIFQNSTLTQNVKDFIFQLLQIDPKQRLGTATLGGTNSIKNHPWLSDINWYQLESKLNLNGPLSNYSSFLNFDNNIIDSKFNLKSSDSSINNQQQQQQSYSEQLKQTFKNQQLLNFNNNNNFQQLNQCIMINNHHSNISSGTSF